MMAYSHQLKLIGVPGAKLLDDEKFTQGMFGVSTPTFVTLDTKADARLQHWNYKNAQTFYFLALLRTGRGHRTDHRLRITDDQQRPEEMGGRRCETIRTGEDDNSREKMQNVRGDSSDEILARDRRFRRADLDAFFANAPRNLAFAGKNSDGD